MDSAAAKAEQKQTATIDNSDLWKETIWGSRDSFIRDRMESEGYSAQGAERYALIWEQARRELKENPPEIMRSV